MLFCTLHQVWNIVIGVVEQFKNFNITTSSFAVTDCCLNEQNTIVIVRVFFKQKYNTISDGKSQCSDQIYCCLISFDLSKIYNNLEL